MLFLYKQKDKPDPDVLLELASYYDLTMEAMMKKVLEVRLFVVSLLYLLVLKEDGTYLTIRPAAPQGLWVNSL